MQKGEYKNGEKLLLATKIQKNITDIFNFNIKRCDNFNLFLQQNCKKSGIIAA